MVHVLELPNDTLERIALQLSLCDLVAFLHTHPRLQALQSLLLLLDGCSSRKALRHAAQIGSVRLAEAACYQYQRACILSFERERSDDNPLIIAALNNHNNVAGVLLNFGFSPDIRDSAGKTALHYSARTGDVTSLCQILRYGANPNAFDSTWLTPMHEASRHCNIEAMYYLINSGAQVNLRDCLGMTALHYAALSNSPLGIQLLLDYGADATLSDQSSILPIHHAAQRGYLEPFFILISKGMELSTRDAHGANVAHYAAKSWNSAVISTLANLSASLLQSRDTRGRTPLHYAAKCNNYSNLEILLSAGVDIDALDNDCNTPLMIAANNNDMTSISMLLARNAKPHFRNMHGLTAYDIAIENYSFDLAGIILSYEQHGTLERECKEFCHNALRIMSMRKTYGSVNNNPSALEIGIVAAKLGDLRIVRSMLRKDETWPPDYTMLAEAAKLGRNDLVQVLISCGISADPKCYHPPSLTALHYAVMRSDVGLISKLLESKVNVNCKDDRGITPLHLAVQQLDLGVVQILLDAESNPDIQDDEGKTALHWAAEYGDPNMVRLLRHHGADSKIRSEARMTALDYAAAKGQKSVYQLLEG